MNFQDLNNIEGLQFVPVDENKVPTVKRWQKSTEKHKLDKWGVGLVCGSPSGNLECLDIDCKYSLTGDLMFENYKKLVHLSDDKLLNKMVVQKTINNGYHLIYRCSKNSGNIKLANRYSTETEKSETYTKTYVKETLDGKDDAAAKKIAEKAAQNDKVKVLFETRGPGGQFVCHPTPGYEFIFGDLQSISEITPEEREVLHNIARQFNEVVEEYVAPKTTISYTKTKGLSSFQDYNERGDVIGLLENNGWKRVGQKGSKTIFLRPGQTTSQTSGNYDHDKKWFSVFSTSTEFEPEHAYQPYAVFAVLECNKDFSAASKKLYELGFGDRFENTKEKEKAPSTRVIPSRVNSEDNDYSFLAKPEDYNGYLEQVIDGTLPQGLTTGIPSLDKYFLFKDSELVMTNGHDNAGKSVVTWYLLLLAAMYHGWKSIVLSSENTLGGFMRKMIQFYWGKPLRGDYAMTNSERIIAQTFIEKHFSLIKSEEDMYNYKDIINMIKKAQKINKYQVALIDPYNGLKIDLSGYSKLSTHEYHYEALSDLKLFGKNTGIGFWINNHAVTASLRAKDGEKKYPVAPNKADTEGGGKFGNKSDTFISIHRIVQHPDDWRVNELHVRKVKDTETGGRPTPIDNPVKIEMYKGTCAYREKLDEYDNREPVDPIVNWHKLNGRQIEIKIPVPEQRLPYKDADDEERARWFDPKSEDNPF